MVNLEVIEDAIAKKFAESGKNHIEFMLESTGEILDIQSYGFNKRASQKSYTISNCNTVIKQGIRLYEVAQYVREQNEFWNNFLEQL